MESKHKHLELIQGVINRMAGNSFLLKGWSVILVSALFALSAKDADKTYIYLAYFPFFAFWILDAFFLWQERLFRELYDHVRALQESDINFSMNTKPFMKNVNSWLEIMFSKTLRIFHGAIIATILIVMFIFIGKGG